MSSFANKKCKRQLAAKLVIGLVFFFLCNITYGQLGISGPTTVTQGNSYNYYGTYNGSQTYPYGGSYTYNITGGIVTGTTNTTVKTGTAFSVIASASVSVTWTGSSGTLNLSCGLGSKTINVTIIQPLDPGSLSPSSQTINYGATPSTITGTAATGGAASPSYSYQWMNSVDGWNWTNISGATNLNYSPGSLYVTTYYKRQVTETTSGSVAYAPIATVAVNPQLTCSISPASQNITAGSSAATLNSSVSGGNGAYTYQWQSSPDNGSWTNVSTASSYNPGVLYSAMYYRLTVTSNGASVTSNTASVTLCSSQTGPIIGLSTCAIGSTIQLSDNTPGGSWSSNNTGVATVDANGVVSGVTTGSATITYTLNGACGTSSAQLGVNVVPISSLLDSLGSGIADPIITDSISLVQNTVKVTQFQQDTLYSSAHSIKNVVALRVIEETNKYIPGDFSATVVIKIEYGHSSNNIYQVDSTKLTVTYTKNAGNKYNAINYLTFNNAEYTRITVVRVDAPTTVNSVSFDTKQVLVLTNSLMATRYYKLADNKKPVLTYTNPSGSAVPDELVVNWNHPAHSNNNYTQLEWTWLEDEMSNAYINGGVFDTTLLFNNNATRIDLAGGAVAGTYNIPLLYGGIGKLFMRVRGVNIMPSGSRSDGPWSGVQTFSFNGHNDSLNWQATTTFVEEGKQKRVVQYYDGSLRARQTVTKDNTTLTTVVAETFYDGQGRAAVQILPAPAMSNIIAYVKNLNKFNEQPDNANPADFFDFTTTSLGNYATPPMDSINGTNRYYSRNNPDWNNSYNKNIPASNGFAYSVTRYTPDATGRIMMQSGVGDSMQMGGKHTTKYFYGTAAKEELDALFGTEVGNYTHYFKNMVQDANGQMGVSYVDMHGRTIATALSGESPVTMQPLNINDTSKYKNQAGKVLTRNLLDNSTNILKGNSIESINTLLVPSATTYSFNYGLTKQTLTMPKCGGGTVSYDCKFDLQISISNESGDTVPVVYNYPGITNINFQQSLLLSAGSYSVRKTLTINQDSLDKFVQQYDTVGVGLCQTLQYLTDSIAAQDSSASGCGITPSPLSDSSCMATLGTYSTYLSNYATSLGDSVGQLSASQVNDIRNQYINDSTFCRSLNANTSSSLENIRKQMLSDMVPYAGQYGRDSIKVSMDSKYNIFSLGGNPTYSQPFYKYPKNQLLNADNYYDPFGNIDSSVLFSRLTTMSKSDFESEFKNSWTKSLLPYHPEFKKLKFAEDSLRASFNFIDSIQVLTTAFDPISSDPFFGIPSRATDKDSITKYSNVSWTGMYNYSMWQMAYGDAFGCKVILDTAPRNTCYNNMPKVFTNTGTVVNTGPGGGNVTLSASIQMQAWTMYKAFYGQVRGDMVNRYINVRPGTTDTADNKTLINQQFRIYFPYNYVQQSQNLGWTSWYPNQSGTLPSVNLNDSVILYSSRCDGYIDTWRLALLKCPALFTKIPDSATREQVVASITNRMLTVCKYGTDAANPYGSSTVAPAYAGANYTSFEQIVNSVFDSLSIPRDLYCHPYGIEWPKPYGKNPLISKQFIATVDTCNCTQWNKLKIEITGAGYNTNSLASTNTYLWNTYQDTISQVLYDGLNKCGIPYYYNCRDSFYSCTVHGLPSTCNKRKCDILYSIPLASAQPLPDFLVCGFSSSMYSCFTCDNFKSLDSTFYSIFARHPVLTGTIANDADIAYNDLFAKYVNFKTGLQYNWLYYADKFNTTSCGIGGISGSGSGLSICLDKKPLNDTTGFIIAISPCQQVRNNAAIKAAILYQYNQQQAMANFKAAYLANCMAVQEVFNATDTIKEYHYTLYYYDEAGNLVKTVPPKGVNPIYRQTWIDSVENFKLTGQQLTPSHNLVTRYCYNSLNQVNIQKSPDGGVSKFWYDRLGRLTVSQNAKQSGSGNVYSYTLFDSLGRITQVGQITGGSGMTDVTAKNNASLQTWFDNAANTRNQITQTVYDTAYGVLIGLALSQQNLRNRVSYSQVINATSDPFPASATYYSYDVHGNVDTLLQDFGNSTGIRNAMNTNNDGTPSGNRFKKMVYNYDLISGKVNQVSYQPGKTDAYYHRYAYDAENRITDVYTGRDSVMLFLFPEREAHYYYYKHGPLARTEVGQLKVQGLDYAYTLQGWLKAVNPAMAGTLTNGTDTTEAYPVVQDAYAFGLNYYKGDYKAIGYSPQSASIIGALGSNAAPLYNGNIAAMSVNLPVFGITRLYNYHYDQLNRIVAMDVYNGLAPSAGTFNSAVNVPDYKERISYDPNGNILTYLRNGTEAGGTLLPMDNLNYKYISNKNQLAYVTDSVAAGNYTTDIDNQTAGNYSYDAIGNLVADASESITNISWSVYGKILSITKSGAQIKYIYDAGCNRIMKQTSTDTTVYVRDASGNVMSVYVKPAGSALAQTEMHLYGSSRLGMATRHLAPDSALALYGGFENLTKSIFTRGEKLFELSNHLGNVLVTISDRRIQNSAGGTTVDYYRADLVNANDYYPFGMLMPGRKYSTSNLYRYGFNGKENDNDVKGEGNQQDYGMRIYDPRLGKFLSVDPLIKKYPELTPYQFASDRPIDGIDLDGLEFLKRGSAAFVLSKGAYKSSAFLGEIYKGDELMLRNKKAYEISAKQIEHAVAYAEKFKEQEAESFEKDKEAHEPGPKPIKTREDKAGLAADAINEATETVELFRVFRDMYKAKYDKETKANIDIANTTWKGLADANYLVTMAANSRTFPGKLNNDKNLTDLVNYITDETVPSFEGDPYNRVIRAWGDLIFKNKDAVKNGTMNFSTLKPVIVTIKEQNGRIVNTFQMMEGNPDKKVQEANDLIKERVPEQQSTLQQGHN